MLQINELSILHRKDLRVMIEDFSLVLNDGDKAVIIGEEGNGKTTLMKWIYDPALVENYTEAKGVREYFWNQTPKDLAAMAGNFGVDPEFFYKEQKLYSLSGGEKVKAQLMKILMQEPTVLLLDEPSNDIDITTLELLEKLINDWKNIVLYISHDETLIENTANMVVHIEQVRRKTKSRYTVAKMPYRKYITERLHNFEKQEQRAINDRRAKKLRDAKYMKIYQSVGHAQAAITRQDPATGKNLKDKMHTVKSMRKRFEREDENMAEMPEQEEAISFKLGGKESRIPPGKTVIEYNLDELRTPKGLEEPRILAKDIFFRIRGSEKICIVGANGAGKTTLLKKIAGELLKRTDIHAEYMPQNYEEILNLKMTPVEYLCRSGDKEERTKIKTCLGSLKYTADEMEHPISELSEGQKAKVLLLKMSLSDANVLILDEPTRNFSPLSGPVIRKMIGEFPGAVISISHDRKYIEEVCDKVYKLTSKGLVESEG